MAKHPKSRRRRFKRYLRGSVDQQLPLGTLASKALLAQIFDDVVVDTTWISSMRATWSMNNWTPLATAGPILVGYAHSDYTGAEIEEFLENTGAWDQGDLVNQEIAKRKIRIVGAFNTDEAGVTQNYVLNDGKPITTKCGWILTEGQSLDMWAYNMGAISLATTDPVVRCWGYANLWPK